MFMAPVKDGTGMTGVTVMTIGTAIAAVAIAIATAINFDGALVRRKYGSAQSSSL